jgi:hypothetical protein
MSFQSFFIQDTERCLNQPIESFDQSILSDLFDAHPVNPFWLDPTHDTEISL